MLRATSKAGWSSDNSTRGHADASGCVVWGERSSSRVVLEYGDPLRWLARKYRINIAENIAEKKHQNDTGGDRYSKEAERIICYRCDEKGHYAD
ncbi:CCHC-type domain-containing protein, partial [Aphis craccivora]